ncbi:hypothetical protein IWX90DRAFT_94568 [Phyllosticta citrichinensis]|uniref:Secreted protein n=1 Tax=Phyllosticta citrichinensis TaxID=1130410 RepID=A0ABR1XF25_9PEZI
MTPILLLVLCPRIFLYQSHAVFSAHYRSGLSYRALLVILSFVYRAAAIPLYLSLRIYSFKTFQPLDQGSTGKALTCLFAPTITPVSGGTERLLLIASAHTTSTWHLPASVNASGCAGYVHSQTLTLQHFYRTHSCLLAPCLEGPH